MKDEYAAQIYCKGIGSGTGHLVLPDVILTARHVLCRRDGTLPPLDTRYEFRLWGDMEQKDEAWRNAEMLWDDPRLDVALLRIVAGRRSETLRQAQNAGQPPTLARLRPSDERLQCLAFGWPKVLKDDEGSKAFPIWATVSSRGHRVGEPVLAQVHDGPETAEGWKGYSGAAARIDDMLFGIVTKADPRFINPVLHVLLLADVPGDTGFWGHMRHPRLIDLGRTSGPSQKTCAPRRIVAIFAEAHRKATMWGQKPAWSWIEQANRSMEAPKIACAPAPVLLDHGDPALAGADFIVIFGRATREGLVTRTHGATKTLTWQDLGRRIREIAGDAVGIFICAPESSVAPTILANGIPVLALGACPDEAILGEFTIRLLEDIARGVSLHAALCSANEICAKHESDKLPLIVSNSEYSDQCY